MGLWLGNRNKDKGEVRINLRRIKKKSLTRIASRALNKPFFSRA